MKPAKEPDSADLLNGTIGDEVENVSGDVEDILKPKTLMDELAVSGVKYSPMM